ncbi:MAG: DNA replication initiation control protein YabA [Peptococcaceae bacterium]|nr:DNA replication initiation control protein YabA [Peptococcaceae bacterium]
MEAKLHSLLAEVQELKNKARELEEENVRLRQELAAVYREGCSAGSGGGEAVVPGGGFFNLLGLYDQEFHVCNLYFGRKRTGDCLFCMAFLRKGQESAAGPEG